MTTGPAPRGGAMRHERALWRRLAYLGSAYGPSGFVRLSPRVIGAAFALALPKVRARVKDNLRRIEAERSPLALELDAVRTFANFASCLAEALAQGGPSPRPIASAVSGREHIERALAKQRGMIVVTAHTGAWETAGPLLGRDFDLDVVIAMEGERDDAARAISDSARARTGIRVVHVGKDPLAALPLAAHLKRGGVVAIQLDRKPEAMRGLPVRVFGRDEEVPSGPFHLAAATGAPIVPVFARRTGFFRYAIEISPPIEVPRGAKEAALAAAASTAAAAMEEFLRAHPTHWFDFGR